MSVHSLGKSVKILCTLTPMMSLTSFLCFIIALIAPYWIYMEEKFPNKNRTVLFGPNASVEFLERHSYGGLWKVCSTSYFEDELICRDIEYFSNQSYEPDPYDSSLVIPYSMLNSAGYFFAAGTLMFAGSILFFLGHFLKKRKILTFASGIIFILSGLLLFVGQIVFIAVFKAEVGGKLVPKTSLSPPLISYTYGCSFTLIILSFLLSELTGTFAIFYFIYHYQYKWSRLELLPSYNQPGRKKCGSSKPRTTFKRPANGTMIVANKTNGFIPNRRHSFDNISELPNHNHHLSNGGSNWKFSRAVGKEKEIPSTTEVPASVLNYEDEHCPRHSSSLFDNQTCFCHNNHCPNDSSSKNKQLFQQHVRDSVMSDHYELWNNYWMLGARNAMALPSLHYNFGWGQPGGRERMRAPEVRTSALSHDESDDEEDHLSVSRDLQFKVNVSKSPVPGKGILKQSKAPVCS